MKGYSLIKDNNLELVPAKVLRAALSSLEGLIGKSFTENLFNELLRLGIDLSSDSESYFLHELREGLDIIFGVEAAELIMERIKKSLK